MEIRCKFKLGYLIWMRERRNDLKDREKRNDNNIIVENLTIINLFLWLYFNEIKVLYQSQMNSLQNN